LFTTRLPRLGSATERAGTVNRFGAINVFEDKLGVPVPLASPRMLGALTRAAEHADVVVAHGHVYPTSVYAAIAARRASRPFVVIQHNPFVDFGPAFERGASAPRTRPSVGGCSALPIASSACRASRSGTCGRIAPSVATVVVSNGVDTNRFRPPSSPASVIPELHRRHRVVCLRRLVRRNGVDVLLDAWDEADMRREARAG